MICRKLSEAMGGSIKCESEVRKGSRFIFDILDTSAASISRSLDDLSLDEPIPNEKQGFDNIPAKILHPDQSPQRPPLPPIKRPSGNKAHVLVVDDEFICGKVTKAMIERCNVSATLVNNETKCRSFRAKMLSGPSVLDSRKSKIHPSIWFSLT